MKMEFEDYIISTDEMQFIVYKKKTIQDSRLTKPENIGKEVTEVLGYFSSLEYALKFLAKKTLLDNDDLSVIKEKLSSIEATAREICLALNQEVTE